MSDETKDPRPGKLRLSRDVKAEDEPEAEKAPPSMKLKRKEPAEEPPIEPSNESARESVKEPAKGAPGQADLSPATERELNEDPTVSGSERQKPNFDPKNPFGDAIKRGEIEKPNTLSPELPSTPALKIDEDAGAAVEAAIDSLNRAEKDVSRSGKTQVLPSILILLILLSVLAGAGYGLWKVLQSPADSEMVETAAPNTQNTQEVQSAQSTQRAQAAQESDLSGKGPIQKAKDAIAKVPVADSDLIRGEQSNEGSTQTAEAATQPAQPAQTARPAQAAGLEPADVAPAAVRSPSVSVEATKQSVAQYLSNVHIGGVRKGDRPMILVNGESFLVGDLVHTETGLKFDGLREGKLAFRDSHGIVYLKSF